MFPESGKLGSVEILIRNRIPRKEKDIICLEYSSHGKDNNIAF